MKCFPIVVKTVWAGNTGLMSPICFQRKEAIMIKEVKMYSVVCDRCGKSFIDEFNGIYPNIRMVILLGILMDGLMPHNAV